MSGDNRCMQRVLTGGALGGAVGGAVGACYGTYEAFAYKVYERKLFSLSLSLSLSLFSNLHIRALKLCINSRKLNFFYADTGNAESQAHRSDDRGERGFVFAVFRRREFVALREAILEGKKESFSVKISIGVKSIT
jgi:hypothetical protein